MLFTNILVAANPIEIEGLIGKCKSLDLKACDKLYAAVRKLTDQALLAKVAVGDENGGVGQAAVGRLTGQAALAKVAFEGKASSVRIAAIGKLTDQTALAKVAENGGDRSVSAAAIAAMDDSNPALKREAGNLGASTDDAIVSVARIKLAIQEPRIRNRFPRIVLMARVFPIWQGYGVYGNILARMDGEDVTFVLSQAGKTLAQKHWSTDFPGSMPESGMPGRTVLPAKVHGGDLLAELLHNAVFTPDDLAELSSSEILMVRQAAVRNLTDQALLAKIAVEDKEADARQVAVEKLTDQALLAKIAAEDTGPFVRQAAFAKLTDQALLAKIAIEGSDLFVRQAAFERLTDQAALAKVIIESPDLRHCNGGSLCYADVVEKLTDQAPLATVVVEVRDADARRKAFGKLTDQAALTKVAVEAEDADIRQAAVGKLTDQALLANIAVEDGDADVRQAASAKVTDPSLRAMIAKDKARRLRRNLFYLVALCILLAVLAIPLRRKFRASRSTGRRPPHLGLRVFL